DLLESVSNTALWRVTKSGLYQHQETNLRNMICRCVVLSSKSQHPKPKTSSNLQTPTNHFPRLWGLGAWNFSGAWGLVLTVAAGSNVAIPETVHLVMRAVARAPLHNRNRSKPTAPRNPDMRRNSGLRNSKSPAVVSLGITVFFLYKTVEI